MFNEEIYKVNDRLVVDNNLNLKSYNNVFVIGDISIIEDKKDLPVTAQVAMQQGFHVAKNLDLLIHEEQLLPFEFEDNGEMISLGIGEASISSQGLTLSGKLAFEARSLIYASKMPLIEKKIKSAASWLIKKKSIFSEIIKKTSKI